METIEWVRQPNLAPSGYKDSQIFVSLVTELFESRRPISKLSSTARDLFTYLLLRRHPITNQDLPLEHVYYNVQVPDRVQLLRDSVKTMSERYLNNDPKAHPYSLMQLIAEVVVQPTAQWVNWEECTLLLLSLYIVSDPTATTDISTVHSCLQLYYKSQQMKPVDPEVEFTNDMLLYMFCVGSAIDRMCFLEYSTKDILREIAYLGAFASLVRACRMVLPDHPLQSKLREEVTQLQQTRQQAGVVKCGTSLTLTRKPVDAFTVLRQSRR